MSIVVEHNQNQNEQEFQLENTENETQPQSQLDPLLKTFCNDLKEINSQNMVHHNIYNSCIVWLDSFISQYNRREFKSNRTSHSKWSKPESPMQRNKTLITYNTHLINLYRWVKLLFIKQLIWIK